MLFGQSSPAISSGHTQRAGRRRHSPMTVSPIGIAHHNAAGRATNGTNRTSE